MRILSLPPVFHSCNASAGQMLHHFFSYIPYFGKRQDFPAKSAFLPKGVCKTGKKKKSAYRKETEGRDFSPCSLTYTRARVRKEEPVRAAAFPDGRKTAEEVSPKGLRSDGKHSTLRKKQRKNTVKRRIYRNFCHWKDLYSADNCDNMHPYVPCRIAGAVFTGKGREEIKSPLSEKTIWKLL